MSPSTGITQRVSHLINVHWLLIVTVVFLVCCSCIHSAKANSINPSVENYDPNIYFDDELNIFERAAPRLGRASPRLGRASPRLGRRGVGQLLSRFNHAGRYRDSEEDAFHDDGHDLNSWIYERRAAPRLGRSIKLDEQKKKY